MEGEGENDSISWLLDGNTWIAWGTDDPLPEDPFNIYEAGSVYELPTDGLP